MDKLNKYKLSEENEENKIEYIDDDLTGAGEDNQ